MPIVSNNLQAILIPLLNRIIIGIQSELPTNRSLVAYLLKTATIFQVSQNLFEKEIDSQSSTVKLLLHQLRDLYNEDTRFDNNISIVRYVAQQYLAYEQHALEEGMIKVIVKSYIMQYCQIYLEPERFYNELSFLGAAQVTFFNNAVSSNETTVCDNKGMNTDYPAKEAVPEGAILQKANYFTFFPSSVPIIKPTLTPTLPSETDNMPSLLTAPARPF